MLAVDDVSLRLGHRTVIRHLNLKVQSGSILGLVGPEGAGKTTLLRMLAGLLQPDRGRIRLFGLDPRNRPAHIPALLGYGADPPALFEPLHADEFLNCVGRLHGFGRRELESRCHEVTGLLQLESVLRTACQALPNGARRKLAIAAALLPDPRVILLDEPTVDLDKASASKLKVHLQHLSKRGKIIVVATRFVEVVEALCNQVALLEGGRLLATGHVEDLHWVIQGEPEPHAASMSASSRRNRDDDNAFRHLLDEIC